MLLKQKEMICENLSRNESGELCFAGMPLSALAKEYGTPLYLYDEEREVTVDFEMYGIEKGAYNATELWTKERLVTGKDSVSASVRPHACVIFRLGK